MSLSACKALVDSRGREMVQHGTLAFPIACYHDDLSRLEVPWHWHEEWEAAVITQGSALVSTGAKKYTLHAGEGFFVNSGVLHGCWNLGLEQCRFHSVVFHPRLVGGSTDSVFYQNYVFPLQGSQALESLCLKPQEAWQRGALDAVEHAWQACVQEENGFELAVRSALSQLIWQIREHMPAQQSPVQEKARRDGERIKAMLGYIDEHLDQPVSTETIARSASISASECLRCFHTTIGITPIQYVRSRRLQQAVQLLTVTQERISDIAAQCGFQDLSYFTKTFRETMGCTPTEYRAAARQAKNDPNGKSGMP